MKLTGLRCQCAACGKYFSRVSVFDKHRTGDYGKDRRCMTTEQMQARGMHEQKSGVCRQHEGAEVSQNIETGDLQCLGCNLLEMPERCVERGGVVVCDQCEGV